MIIAQISDSHIDPESDKLDDRLRDLQCVVDDINNHHPAPNMVIHTGDIVHNGTQEKYDLALTILRELEPPLHVCAGNRDDKHLIAVNFQIDLDNYPHSDFLQYSIDDHVVRVIALDTTCIDSNMGDYCEERANTLNIMLAEEPRKPTALFMHHPPFKIVESKHPYQFDNWNKVEYLAEVIRKNDQIKHLFCGHTHRNAIGDIVGIPASTTASIAVDLRLGETPKSTEFVPTYQIHKFDGSKFKSKTVTCRNNKNLRGFG